MNALVYCCTHVFSAVMTDVLLNIFRCIWQAL